MSVLLFSPSESLHQSLAVPARMENAHIKETGDVLSYFGVTEDTGLTPEQVKKNLSKYGFNGEGDAQTVKNGRMDERPEWNIRRF